MSKAQKLSSIYFEWDLNGNISHRMESYFQFNEYQKIDGLLLGTILLISGQLGILNPKYSLHIVDRVLDFLDNPEVNPESINPPLNSARIDLFQKKKTVVCTFHPSYLANGTMQPEVAVSRLLGNLPPYFCQNLDLINRFDSELFRFFRVGLLVVVYYYLSSAFPKGTRSGLFSTKRFKQIRVQLEMLKFTFSIYPYWSGGLNLPETEFKSNFEETLHLYNEIIEKS